ncbi:hypothetical protein AAIA72_12795 [Hahella sp. SMD15-11]|uniref:Uncharacterized protein n=1 Tax=Thermohahella caldifontis TaxID=3142973 RepID=A0AB39UTS5_9GAMM
MSGNELPHLLRLLTFALSMTLALACLVAGLRMLRTQMVPAPATTQVRRVLGMIALVTSVGWGWLAATQLDKLQRLGIEDLPPPAAGLMAGSGYTLPAPAQVADEVTDIESALLDVHNPRFIRIRDELTRALMQDPRFTNAEAAIGIALDQHPDAAFIRYLVDEKPGMLTVIYYVKQNGHQRMLVYWPQVAGDTLIYTPIGGPGVQALSGWLIEKADAPVAQSSAPGE